MYNPYENNNTNNTNEPLDQNTEMNGSAENTQSTAPEKAEEASSEYHYTGGQVRDRASSETQTTAPYGGQSSYPTQTGWPYGNQPQAPSTYTWNGAQQGQVPYYTPVQPKQKKHRDGKKAKRFALRAVAAVLCCAVVSLASVGIFAAMIQTGFKQKTAYEITTRLVGSEMFIRDRQQ